MTKSTLDMATKEDYNIAKIWLHSNNNTEMLPADNQVINPFTVVPDQHNSQNNRGKYSNQSKNLPDYRTHPEKDRQPNQSMHSGYASANTTPASI